MLIRLPQIVKGNCQQNSAITASDGICQKQLQTEDAQNNCQNAKSNCQRQFAIEWRTTVANATYQEEL